MRRVVATVALLVVVPVLVGTAGASPGLGSPDRTADALGQTAPGNGTANNSTGASLGASISSFMQSQAEQTGETVTHGMWSVAFDAGDARARSRLASSRVRQMRSTLANLTEARRELLAARRAGNVSTVEFRARMNAIQARIRALSGSVEATAETLNRTGTDGQALADLRRAVRNASEGAGPPSGVPAGPGDDGPGGDAPGRDGGPGAPAANGTENGPPDDSGLPGNDGNASSGAGEDDPAGNGQGGGPPGDDEGGGPTGGGDGPPGNGSTGPGDPGLPGRVRGVRSPDGV